MKMGIDKRLALVTGASRGIGSAICESLAREGANIIAIARNGSDLENLKSKIGNGDHHFVVADLTNNAVVVEICADLIKQGRSPDIIVNNLGGTLGITDPLCSSIEFLQLMQFNLGIAIDINRTFIPHMQSQKWGRITHISSISALENQGPPSYSAAKAALNAYVRGLARYLAADNVILTSLMPGAIYTEGGYWDEVSKNRPEHLTRYLEERMATKRLGHVSEIAELATFLVSEHSSFMVGSSILADGGQGRVFPAYD
jgi:3-oxoacyl-[acyl-carrier protein] reductase